MSGVAVGYDRALRLDWLDRAASLALAGTGRAEAQRQLRAWLLDRVEGQEAAAKTALVLGRVWFPDDPALVRMRDEAGEALLAVGEAERLAVHWALLLATYPFFRDTVAIAGRLLRLQPTFTSTQLRQRLVEAYGDRAYVERARRHVVQSLVWWQVLDMVGRRGVFQAGPVVTVRTPMVERLLLQAQVLATGNGTAALDGLLHAPQLFPFSLADDASTVAQHPRFALSTVAGQHRLISIAG